MRTGNRTYLEPLGPYLCAIIYATIASEYNRDDGILKGKQIMQDKLKIN